MSKLAIGGSYPGHPQPIASSTVPIKMDARGRFEHALETTADYPQLGIPSPIVRGRRLKVESDAKLAKTHAAGATVTVMLPMLHETYGLINIAWPRYWVLHFKKWGREHERLVELDAKLLALPIEEGNQRSVMDDALLEPLYATGVELVLHAILAFAHLTLEFGRVTATSIDPRNELSERLSSLLKVIEFKDVAQDPGWQGFIELHKYRDAIMHPAENNVYGADEGSWAQVPLAWFASGKAIRTSATTLQFFEELAQFWEQRKEAYDRPGILHAIKRGIKSLHPAKKPLDARPAWPEVDRS